VHPLQLTQCPGVGAQIGVRQVSQVGFEDRTSIEDLFARKVDEDVAGSMRRTEIKGPQVSTLQLELNGELSRSGWTASQIMTKKTGYLRPALSFELVRKLALKLLIVGSSQRFELPATASLSRPECT
jgi:hypothetical protein